MRKILLTYAVKDEFNPITLKGCEIIYILTGIGKAKSAMKLTEAIYKEKPDLVINMGTAGTLNHNIGDIFTCQRFIDRDFHSVNLPGVEYEIDFTSFVNKSEIVGNLLVNSNQGTCNTGDSFVTEAESVYGDVVDMEAFAQAIVCKEYNIPFIAVKYVTDLIGQNSVKHWEDKLADARKELSEWFLDK